MEDIAPLNICIYFVFTTVYEVDKHFASTHKTLLIIELICFLPRDLGELKYLRVIVLIIVAALT